MEKRVVLRRSQDVGGIRHLEASLASNDDVRIEGQDLGAGVEQSFGEGLTEYEYILTIRAPDVPALLEALDAKTDVLAALQKQFGDQYEEDVKSFLDRHGVPYAFWSRIGD